MNRSISNSKVAYVVKRYPRFSETFIVNEVLAHEAAGLPIEIFSLRPPVDTHFQDIISQVRAPLTYLSNGSVKAEMLWKNLGSVAGRLPELSHCLNDLLMEDVLEVHCAIGLAEQIVSKRITHIHAHFASSAATVARLASLLTGIPYSITAHAKDIFHNSVDERDLARKIRDSIVTFTVSEFNLENLGDRFPECSSRLTRLYNGMHIDCFPYQSPSQRKPLIVAVGRLVEKKGFADLIEACRLLKQQTVPFRCVVVGGGELEVALRKQILELGLEKDVEVLGPMPQREVKTLIQSASVLAAPCIEGGDGNKDGLPTVLLEAMSLGTPCVSTPVTGIPEAIVNRETGLLVRQRQPQELAHAITLLLNDAKLRSDLASSARKLIEKEFDIERNAARQREYFVSQAMEDVPELLSTSHA